MPVANYKAYAPKVASGLFLAPDAWVIGKCELEENISIFFGAVLRGDINKVVVGSGTNIQEHSVLHTSHGLGDTVVGRNITVGHRAILHGCHISDRCIIGMGSVILDEAEVGECCIIGAHSLLSMGKKFPAGSLIFGSPAKVVRELSDEEVKSIDLSAQRYQETGAWYRDNLSGAQK